MPFLPTIHPLTPLGRALCTWLACWGMMAGHAQPAGHSKRLALLSVDNWTTDNGLPSNTLLETVQSADGYLWMGSYDGLIRFDGVAFDSYGKNDTPIFRTNVASSLEAAADSSIWIGTHGSGLLRHKLGQFRQFGDPNVFIQSILLDESKGLVWVGTRERGCWVFHYQTETWKRLETPLLEGATVLDLAKDRQGRVWMATTNGLFSYKAGEWQRYVLEDAKGKLIPRRLFTKGEQLLWVGTERGVYALEGRRLQWVPRFGKALIHHLYRDKAGYYWIGSLQGLMRWHPHERGLEWLYTKWGQRATDIYNTYEDAEGNIWIASYRLGLFRVKNSNFNNFNYTTQGQPAHPITSLARTKNGYLAGNAHGQLFEVQAGGLVPFPLQQQLPENKIHQMLSSPDGNVWIATFNGILRLGPDGAEHFYGNNSLLDGPTQAKSLLWAPDSTLWVGTFNHGLLQVSPSGRLLRHFSKQLGNFPSNYVMSLQWLPEGLVVAGTNDRGVVALHPDRGVLHEYNTASGLASNLVFNTYTDSARITWVVSNGGLSRIDTAGRIFNYTHREGLPYDNPFDFVEDARGNVWMPTSRGIIRVPKSQLNAQAQGHGGSIAWEMFNRQDGIVYEQCTGAAFSMIDSLQNLWVPSIGGLTQVNTNQMSYNPYKPPVYVEAIWADERRMAARGRPEIRIPAGTHRFTFEYTALSFWAPGKVKFRYKLDGYDRDWVEAGSARKATYTNLPPGKHAFRVMACNNDGVWNWDGDVVHFYIEPKTHQTGWFAFLATIAVIGLLRSLYTLRLMAANRRNRELEEKVQERTQEIERQRSEIAEQHRLLQEKQAEIAQWNRHLESKNQEIETKNAEIARKNQELEASGRKLLALNLALKQVNDGLEETVRERTQELERSTQEMQRLIDQLSASHKELDTFIYQAPHDFRGPIARLLGIVQIARMEAGPDAMPYLDKLDHVAKNMDTMLRKLLKVYDIMEHEQHYTTIDLEPLYQEVLQRLGTRFPLADYRLSFQQSPPGYRLYTDAELLSIVLENLLENAMLYTQVHPPGKRQVSVSLEAYGKKEVSITVSDNGAGIDEHSKAHIFSSFFKASDLSQGNGLGLYLVKKSMERLRGHIDVHSKAGYFTHMKVWLPRQ